MQALTYHGTKDVRVETVPDPGLVADDDILLRVTATAICGSDLHIYRGKIPDMKDGDILGHEFMGVVEDVGPGVTRLAKGDRVVVPFTISCGTCFFCDRMLYAACENSNPDRGAIINKKSARSGASPRANHSLAPEATKRRPGSERAFSCARAIARASPSTPRTSRNRGARASEKNPAPQ